MKVKIDTNALDKLNLSIEEFALLMFYYQEHNMGEVQDKLIEKGFISKNLDSEKDIDFWVTNEGKDILDATFADSIKTTNKYKELAETLISLYPKGHKPGTNLSWKGNITDIINKLKAFKTKYKYTDEQIIQATKDYVAHFGEDTTYMKILKYFILKNNESTLADIIDNGLPTDAYYDNTRVNYD